MYYIILYNVLYNIIIISIYFILTNYTYIYIQASNLTNNQANKKQAINNKNKI